MHKIEQEERRLKAKGIKWGWILFCCLAMGIALFSVNQENATPTSGSEPIKWVDFNVTYEALEAAMEADIQSYNKKVHLDWIDTLSYLAASYGGDFSQYEHSDMEEYFKKRKKGISVRELSRKMKFFSYYQKAYGAVLGGMLGTYKIQVPAGDDGDDGQEDRDLIWKEKYGLKAFSPIAKDYWYTHYDDFGNSRSYGYSRKHFGHDLMASVGTPVIAVEGGTIEALGWNQYGGWRLGIRSYDKQRYYYYAHLRKDHPYVENLHIGKTVNAGDVIGYAGQTGYSLKENTNNIDTPHLHYGMELVFEEKAKDSPNQIWVDLYAITRLLSHNQTEVYQKEKEYYRKYQFSEENYYLKEKKAAPAMTEAEIVESTKTADSGNPESREVPIIMYHSLLKNPAIPNRYVIHPTLFEQDLQYLKEQGYTAVLMKDLINYTARGIPLPEKPIVLTFDDGFYNNYTYGLPLLQKYDMKAVISVIGTSVEEFSDSQDLNPAYAYVTWTLIQEMENSGIIEIQNHSYDAHSNTQGRNGLRNLPGESEEQYTIFLEEQVLQLQEKLKKNTGILPTTVAYPFGSASEMTERILKKMGFKATLSSLEGMNLIKKGDPDSLYYLKRFLRPPDLSSQSFFEKITADET